MAGGPGPKAVKKNGSSGLGIGKALSDYGKNSNPIFEDDITPGIKKIAGAVGGALGGRGLKGMSLTDTADAGSKPNLGGRSGMGTRAGTPKYSMGGMSGRGSAKAAPSYGKPATGVTSGTGMSDADKAYKAAQKKRGDDYLRMNPTDYGLGSAVNDFVGKKKK